MLADTVDYGEYKFDTRSESIVFSMQTMTAKMAGALAGFTSSLTLSFVGYVPNVPQSEETILGLRVVMFIVSSILILATIIIYFRYYRLNGSFYKNMMEKLEQSRARKLEQKAREHQQGCESGTTDTAQYTIGQPGSAEAGSIETDSAEAAPARSSAAVDPAN